jgi:aminodeoxyfutalosine synthase
MSLLWKDSELFDIVEKVEKGERITDDEAVRCLKTKDINTLGYLADLVRRRVAGDRVSYSIYLNINHTNVCDIFCKLCAFYRTRKDSDAYLLTHEEITGRVRSAIEKYGIREVHIVGGVDFKLPFEYNLEMIRKIRAVSDEVFIKAFTAVEMDYFAKQEKKSYREILLKFKEAGLSGLPGGGAELFAERVRKIICTLKIGREAWLEVHRQAHQIGLPSNATMLYGHFETPEEVVDHMKSLRDLQDETRGFNAFIPLSFHPKNTSFETQLAPTDGFKDIRIFATARIYLDNFPHIKAFWSSLGVKFSQALLSYGVDDLGGTALDEKIFHDAGAETPVTLEREELENLIRETGRNPVQVDSSYHAVASE